MAEEDRVPAPAQTTSCTSQLLVCCTRHTKHRHQGNSQVKPNNSHSSTNFHGCFRSDQLHGHRRHVRQLHLTLTEQLGQSVDSYERRTLEIPNRGPRTATQLVIKKKKLGSQHCTIKPSTNRQQTAKPNGKHGRWRRGRHSSCRSDVWPTGTRLLQLHLIGSNPVTDLQSTVRRRPTTESPTI